jgi:maltose alpha-D-glucosyltransferase/alpha-amylase
MDVASMLRSFQYAPYAALLRRHPDRLVGNADDRLEPWIHFWCGWVSVGFLKGYFGIAKDASFWPRSQSEFQVLLDAHLLEKAVYEIGYELNNRPEWVRIPLRGVRDILETAASKAM